MIAISPRLDAVLKRNPALFTFVNNSLFTFSEWLEKSRIVFFPEYTDHGPQHIADVLTTSEQLISQTAWEVLTPEDAGAIVLATLLHDCAMHLTQDGFIRLVKGETALQPVAWFDSRTWPQLWEGFASEVKRFSEVDNERMFGSRSPVKIPRLENWAKWTEEQRWLIGEFIRRHHPRLAHEIALYGFPGSREEVLKLDEHFSREFADLIGLVARSHGMALRPCAEYLDEKWQDHVQPAGVHAIFAMALLRIADYLQIDASRAPGIQLRLQALRSQTSIREWDKHRAVPILQADERDAEGRKALIRESEVKTIGTLLGLRRLFTDIQRELDSTWAVLGEVYSRLTQDDLPLYKLGLRIRRLRSSLDEPKFLEKLAFVPEGPRFRSADGKLFALLIEPLYGGNIDAGVRELVQNAVDAVRELEVWRAHHPGEVVETDAAIEADVEVDLIEEKDEKLLRVQDRGIGMNLDIVRDYYLTVGASYRQSASWKDEFAGDDQKSTVLRTGYFGIGALAGFLVGEEMRVTTRRAGSKRGLQFTATLHADFIQMNVVSCPVGTTIEIPLRKELIRGYGWSPNLWYLLPRPTIRIKGQITAGTYPELDSEAGPDWQRLEAPVAPIVFWARKRRFDARIAHNGFQIEHGDRDLRELWSGCGRLRVLIPNLHILDPEGNAPKPYIDLSRTKFLQDSFKPMRFLFVDVLRDYMAYLLATLQQPIPGRQNYKTYPLVETVLADQAPERAPDSYLQVPRCNPVVYTSHGLAPLDAGVLKYLGIRSLFLLRGDFSVNTQALLADGTCGILPFDIAFQEMKRLTYPEHAAREPPARLKIISSHLLAYEPKSRDSLSSFVLTSGSKRAGKLLDSEFTMSAFSLEPKLSSRRPLGNQTDAALEWVLEPGDESCPEQASLQDVADSFQERPSFSPFVLAWRHFIGDWAIPYDPAEREKKLANAFAVLGPYITKWRKLSTEETGK